MKRPVVLYIAVTMDGYIARENGELDWLYEAEWGIKHTSIRLN